MKQTEVDLITKLFDTKAQDTDLMIKLAMEDVRRTIAVAAANTDGQIHELNKTIKDHNGRLGDVEEEQQKQKKVMDTLTWIEKHWYIAAGLVVLVIFIMIPIVEVLGIKGLISLIK